MVKRSRQIEELSSIYRADRDSKEFARWIRLPIEKYQNKLRKLDRRGMYREAIDEVLSCYRKA